MVHEALITDFNTSREVGAFQGVSGLTLQYSDPSALGTMCADYSSDVFSLAATLFEWLHPKHTPLTVVAGLDEPEHFVGPLLNNELAIVQAVKSSFNHLDETTSNMLVELLIECLRMDQSFRPVIHGVETRVNDIAKRA